MRMKHGADSIRRLSYIFGCALEKKPFVCRALLQKSPICVFRSIFWSGFLLFVIVCARTSLMYSNPPPNPTPHPLSHSAPDSSTSFCLSRSYFQATRLKSSWNSGSCLILSAPPGRNSQKSAHCQMYYTL